MTVITKAIGEKKKSDNMEQPLVVDAPADNASADPEAQRPQRAGGPYLRINDQVFILRRANLRPNSWTLYCLLFTAILGMGIGVIGGLYIYRHYARDQMHRFRTGWYSIPYEGANRSPIDREGLLGGPGAYPEYHKGDGKYLDIAESLDNVQSNYFKERFEIDLDKHYEEIDVPDFRGGRQGRFIHDFHNNLTGIIDIDGQCCFVMPLNRKRVLPPRNIYDLLKKMHNGYYEVDTEVVRETMRAVFPPIRDLSTVGAYIAKECKHMPTYLLEKVDYEAIEHEGGVVKRNALPVVYGQFAGQSIVEWHIVNLDKVLENK